MANKLTLDFENNLITWDTDVQKGTEYYEDLSERKADILKAMGYESVDFTPVVDSINDFMNGKISKEELKDFFNEFAEK